ncbi:hypothetical protein NDU88_006990 [Pleurodeles waltl]|uniref:Uncharacterized protein n=1 Tax=Pleurodeles waltl TaxID=8319 RepID=A0AAV7LU51_PLEWA|nr:hypothetical protein NDU88_006990 [Pleurodeles waltl]
MSSSQNDLGSHHYDTEGFNKNLGATDDFQRQHVSDPQPIIPVRGKGDEQHRNTVEQQKQRSSIAYRSSDSSRSLAGGRFRQFPAGTGHSLLVHGPGVPRAQPLRLWHRQPGRLRPQTGPERDGSPPSMQAPIRVALETARIVVGGFVAHRGARRPLLCLV